MEDTTTQPTTTATKSRGYNPPNEIDVSRIKFTKHSAKPGGQKKTGFKATSFGISLSPLVDQQQAKGGKGKGKTVVKTIPLTLTSVSALRSGMGVRASAPETADDKVRKFIRNPNNVNLMSMGAIEKPDGVKFEILYYLDPTNPNDQALKELSAKCRTAYQEYMQSDQCDVEFDDGFIDKVNGFVRTSKESQQDYIAMELSTRMVTKEDYEIVPTIFRHKETVFLWSDLMNMTFTAVVNFKVSHVMMIGKDRASFKIYVTSCELEGPPVRAESSETIARQDCFEKMKQQLMARSGVKVDVDDDNVSGTGGEKGSRGGGEDEEEEGPIIEEADDDTDDAVKSETPPPPPPPKVVAVKKVSSSAALPRKTKASAAPPPLPPLEAVAVVDGETRDDEKAPDGLIVDLKDVVPRPPPAAKGKKSSILKAR